MSMILVFGLSGLVGEALRAPLRGRGRDVLALTRVERDDAPGVTWIFGDLPSLPFLPDGVDTVLSAGPLDRFADWYARVAPPGVRVVALGSTSVFTKAASPDAGERETARRLADAEARVFATASATGGSATILRPTLIYGDSPDRSLTPMAEFARRHGWFILPARGTGLRQPVHAGDVAEAMLRCLDRPATAGRAFDLPGGERLPAAEMFERSLRRRAPGARIWRVPAGIFRLAVAVAGRADRIPVSARGFLARLGQDQVADASAVETALDLRLRPFQP